MRTITFDGDRYLLTLPTVEDVKTFPSNALIQNLRRDGFFMMESSDQLARLLVISASSAQTGMKREVGVFRKRSNDDPIEVASDVSSSHYYLRPCLIPLNRHGQPDDTAQGDCPNGTLTTGGAFAIDAEDNLLVDDSILKLNPESQLLIVDTQVDVPPITWMWWNRKLIACVYNLKANAWFIARNNLMEVPVCVS